jgi:hypothetical protein
MRATYRLKNGLAANLPAFTMLFFRVRHGTFQASFEVRIPDGGDIGNDAGDGA